MTILPMDDALQPGLYIVATPIGNLSDLSPRAAGILARADLIAVEDSRVTAKLLHHIGVKRPMASASVMTLMAASASSAAMRASLAVRPKP